ncbi:MAG TPA: hypothetical protein VOA87_17050 [Thermoanaerobaculia bacterium]|nr:hypothetical protein [Thermoanaerobaculia bacterium]
MAAVLLLAALHMLVFDRGLGGDGWASFAALESIVDDGDLWLENNQRGVMNGLVRSPSGHLVMQYPPGILILDLPPFLAGRAADAILPTRWHGNGAELPPAGRVPRRVFLSAAAIVLARNAATLLGLLWLALALRRLGFGEKISAAATALAFFGGPLLFYSLVAMTHAPAFALASLLLLLLVRQRETGSLRLAVAVGLVAGLATLVRFGAVALLPAALLGLASASGGERRQAAGTLRVTAALAAFALPLLLLPFYWRASSGTWGPPGYGGAFHVTAASPWNVLLSPRHGLFLFHPALLLAAAGLAGCAWTEARTKGAPRSPSQVGIGTIALLWFVGVALLHGWWSEWANAGGFGQRFLIDALPSAALGFAWLLAGPGGRLRRPALLACCVAAAFGYLLFFAAVAGLVPAPAPYPWPQRLADYRPLIERPPRPGEVWAGLERASLLVRSLRR